jgi:hypothetical protein
MNRMAGSVAGFILGLALTFGLLAGVAAARGRGTEAPGGEGEAAAGPKSIAGLKAEIAELEKQVAAERARPKEEATDRASVAARRYAAAAKAGMSGDRASSRDLRHVLDREVIEHLLSDEEAICLPGRDRMVPEFLDAWGLPLDAEQEAKWEELLAFEEGAWAARLAARDKERWFDRTMAAVELAGKIEEWSGGILTPEQQQALGGTALGVRTCPAGKAIHGGANGAIWNEDFSIHGTAGAEEPAGVIREFARQYAEAALSWGPMPRDAAGRVPLAWRRRQIATQAEYRAKMLRMEGLGEELKGWIEGWGVLYDAVE